MNDLSIQDLNLPAFMPLEKTFGVQPFTETKEGKQMISTVATRQNMAKLINIVTIVLAIGFAVINYFGVKNGRILQAVVSGAFLYGIGSLIKYLYTRFMISPVQTNYVNKRRDYAYQLAQNMADHFNGYFYTFGNGYFFFYNQDMCLYIDAENGEWVGYDRDSIKSVELSHVHIGSSTVSQTSSSGVGVAWTSNIATYSGSSTTHSESTSHYEWRFDIFSGFFHYPNLTMVFPDNGTGEDFAKKAKALLS